MKHNNCKCNFKYEKSIIKKVKIIGHSISMTKDIISRCSKCGKKQIIKGFEIKYIGCWDPPPFYYEETEDFWKNINKNIVVENPLKKEKYIKIIRATSKMNEERKIIEIKSMYERYKFLREYLSKLGVSSSNKTKIYNEIRKEIGLRLKQIDIKHLEVVISKKEYENLRKMYNYLTKVSIQCLE